MGIQLNQSLVLLNLSAVPATLEFTACAQPNLSGRYPSVARMKCHRGGFHFLKTLDSCHYPEQDGHREAHVLSCWPETSHPASPGRPRPICGSESFPGWPERLAQLSRAHLNKTPQIEIEAAAAGGILSVQLMHPGPCVSRPLSQCLNASFLHLSLLPSPLHHSSILSLQILKHYCVLDLGETTANHTA